LESGPGVKIWITAAETGPGVKDGIGVSVGKTLGSRKGVTVRPSGDTVAEGRGEGSSVALGSMVGMLVTGPEGSGCVGVEIAAMVKATAVGR
jgi:hypothetical protein